MKVYYAAVIKQVGAYTWLFPADPFRTRKEAEDYAGRINEKLNTFHAEVIEADVRVDDAEHVSFSWDEWREKEMARNEQ